MLCSVNADTVLKWVKKGSIKARQTAGGHYRIERGELDRFLTSPESGMSVKWQGAAANVRNQRCWEFLAGGSEVQPECRECLVYKVRASWCFRLGSLSCPAGQVKHLCRTPCSECLYYRHVSGAKFRALIVTGDEAAIVQLAEKSSATVEVGFARNGYEASAVLCTFRPDVVVVDDDLLRTTEAGLVKYLGSDARVPGMKIVVATNQWPRIAGLIEKPAGVAGIVPKPIRLESLEGFAAGYAVEQIPPAELRAEAGGGWGDGR